MQFILLNGPPRSGKDALAEGLRQRIDNSVHWKMAEPLRNAVPAMFNIGQNTWWTMYERHKEVPQPELMGMTPRQAMIWLSEDVMKPAFGQDVFGHLMANACAAAKEHNIKVIISDIGFQPECEVLLSRFGAENFALVRLSRFNSSFANDSRRYVSLPVPTFDFDNNTTIDAMVDAVFRFSNDVLNHTPEKPHDDCNPHRRHLHDDRRPGLH